MRTNRKIDPDVGCLSTKSMPICKLKTCLLLVPNPLVLHNRAFYMKETVYLSYINFLYTFLFGMFAFLFRSTFTNHFNVFSASSVCEYVIYSMAGQWRQTVTAQEEICVELCGRVAREPQQVNVTVEDQSWCWSYLLYWGFECVYIYIFHLIAVFERHWSLFHAIDPLSGFFCCFFGIGLSLKWKGLFISSYL